MSDAPARPGADPTPADPGTTAGSTAGSDAGSAAGDWRLARPEAHAPGMPLVTVIGDGQLARMTQQAGIELGLTVRLLAAAPDASAAQATGDVVLGDYTDPAHVRAVAADAAAVTFDHEHVPNEILDELIADGVNVQPQPSALINAQDKLVMRRRLRELGAPVPPFLDITSVEDATGFHDAVDGAVCLKARRGGYDGKGVWFPEGREETASLVADLLEQGVPLMAEKKVTLVRELSAMVARRPSGECVAWPVVESVQRDGVCAEAVAPAPCDGSDGARAVLRDAEALAVDVARELGVTGVLAVELFETTDDAGQPQIIVNELAMRPHNTGHWTQDGCVTSQFEQHLRAVLDRPLGSTALTAPVTVMANVLGGATDPATPLPERMDEVWRRFPGARIHVYGKEWRPGRKLGHVTMTLPVGVAGGGVVPSPERGAGEATGPSEEQVATLRAQARLAAGYLVDAEWEDGWAPE
ncbi:5-(carboxyamino)imidazole ribonucleotide synthase [Corynebacterium bovis]|uniref:N5-carboxyaminoimidazole ribonucleotide synthase n=2 Tax=Corynebacterium bovis TaxID=36808 RepID=A0A426PZB2_9CORY|nr:5-(carboxyamino)imidazole ribonucleotide synthase [Corynebacterium bovis]MDN8579979.1 5-(carboxyamino)imidazole ribonucleotide synthase [Corynebacterium bovis]RRO86871.1 5-(carboxyamino)imidazole ribonucleotide synthase [Corynebacterium bovis]